MFLFHKSYKKVISIFVFLSIFSFISATSYKINDIRFNINGITKPVAIERNIDFKKGTVFENEETLLNYINKLKQNFENTRNFSYYDISYSIIQNDENEINLVNLEIVTKDSSHFLPLPYGTFSSSKGISAKLKIKDTNFLGTMNPLTASLDFTWKPNADGTQYNIFEPKISFDYNHPFKISDINFTWNNYFDISYEWGKTSPEWNANTGITAYFPLNNTTLITSFTQSFIHEYDYEDSGDGTFFREVLYAATPIHICDIPNLEKFSFTPSTSLTYNWDPFIWNGPSGIKNTEIQSPVLNISGNFNLGKTDWDGNFRNGLNISVGPTVNYNIGSYFDSAVSMFNIGVNANAIAFKSFKTLAFNARFWGFAYIFGINNPKIDNAPRIDSYLRGVVDDRFSTFNSAYKQADTPIALVFNFDMPVHILTTHWEDYAITKKIPFISKLNFEIQASPFIDIALIQTTYERQGYQRLFDFRDGFYCAGLEILVYPQNWKSYVIRASAGIDIGRKLFGPLIEKSWRDENISSLEISIGLGLYY
ncbi:MAG: hypothetical protein HUK25_04935 [Treponema sp.]|nr:hypothetical protein [Treponema sp.]